MKAVGIICEYNPFHLGHARHIEKTKQAVGDDCVIVCVMSGNYVQRGDFAVFNKHSRAEAAVFCGADLVIELPTPYALSSAEGFAKAGVYLLENTGICDYISFGSESGDIEVLKNIAGGLATPEADDLTRKWLKEGLPYASARQNAISDMLGAEANILKKANNLLGVEYLNAISALNSTLRPIVIKRTGGEHDGDFGYSASRIRKMLTNEEFEKKCLSKPNDTQLHSIEGGMTAAENQAGKWISLSVPLPAWNTFKKEIAEGRGPVSMKRCESAILSRLRSIAHASKLSHVSEGLGNRFIRYARTEPTIDGILTKTKTKRYTMSRLRRLLLCACLNIPEEDTNLPPPYIRVLAMNQVGMIALKEMRGKTKLPIITKPALAHSLDSRQSRMFSNEVSATDFFILAYPDIQQRLGGAEWRTSPKVVKSMSVQIS